MRLVQRFSSISIAIAIVIGIPVAASAQAVIGVGANGFFEDSKLTGERQIAVLEEDESYEYKSDGFLTASLWFLVPLTDRIRVGSAIDYYGSYASLTLCDPEEQDCEDPENEFEPERFEFGKLLEFYGRAEYALPVVEDLDLILGAVFGIPILFPGGDLRDTIDELGEEGASILGTPRIGYLLGPNLGARWRVADHLSFRADTMVKWERIFVFRVRQDIDGIAFRKTWTTGTLRYEFGLGFEVAL